MGRRWVFLELGGVLLARPSLDRERVGSGKNFRR